MAHFCEQYLIGIEPNPKIMLDWVLENDAKITIQVIQTRFGEMLYPTEQIERWAQMVVQFKTVRAQLTKGGSWSQQLRSPWLGGTEETVSRFWCADTRQTPKRVASRNE